MEKTAYVAFIVASARQKADFARAFIAGVAKMPDGKATLVEDGDGLTVAAFVTSAPSADVFRIGAAHWGGEQFLWIFPIDAALIGHKKAFEWARRNK